MLQFIQIQYNLIESPKGEQFNSMPLFALMRMLYFVCGKKLHPSPKEKSRVFFALFPLEWQWKFSRTPNVYLWIWGAF